MLPRHYRLTKSIDYEKVYKKGRHFRSPYGKIIILERLEDKESPSRFGIIAPAKTGNAVKRSTAKRRIREALRKFLPEMKPGHDVSIILWTTDFSQADFERAVRSCLKNIMK